MAAPWNPPKKNEDFEFDICLEDYANPGWFKSSPTLAAGDVKVSQNNGALANITTLPTVSPAGSTIVRVQLSAAEMNTDKVTVVFIDQTAPSEWCDAAITILTTT
jgi:hypothetical protein